MAPTVIYTCRECRAWQHPGPDTVPSAEKYSDSASRWRMTTSHSTTHTWRFTWYIEPNMRPSRSRTRDEMLCEAMAPVWIQVFGPFQVLVVDRERGLFTAEADDFFRTRGTTICKRAPGQHARIVERRGPLLRRAMHCIEEQLQSEGHAVTFSQLLAQSVFSGNAMLSYKGGTPYNARSGTQAAMLPDIKALHDDPSAWTGAAGNGCVKLPYSASSSRPQLPAFDERPERIQRAGRSPQLFPWCLD